MGWNNGEAARRERVRKAKERINKLVDQGRPYNPAGVSNYTRDRGATNANRSGGQTDKPAFGTSGSGVAGRVISGDRGTARTPASGTSTFYGVDDYSSSKARKKKKKQ